jgi:sugar diacid utilization regulator
VNDVLNSDTLSSTRKPQVRGTFKDAWVADLLVCHPNTVRHRLRRSEQRTGRPLSRPRNVAELCLAFEVHRMLM